MTSDKAYVGSNNWLHLKETVQSIMGFTHVVPAHQEGGAENLLSQILVKPKTYIPGNMRFTTPKAYKEMNGSTFVDVIINQAHISDKVDVPFKGNIYI